MQRSGSTDSVMTMKKELSSSECDMLSNVLMLNQENKNEQDILVLSNMYCSKWLCYVVGFLE